MDTSVRVWREDEVEGKCTHPLLGSLPSPYILSSRLDVAILKYCTPPPG